ncbi:MAG: thymidine kinase [Candidatus Levybacteria bacterium]|nr:thymidine kinase [Candidatus Levybacteria bacterium]
MKGKLTVITGCMFSGKTTRLILLAQEALAIGKKIEIFYPEIDNRYTKNYITSHDMLQLPSQALPLDVTRIDAHDKEVVFIDEVQFFKPTIIGVIEKMREQGIVVIASGLDTNYRAEPFGSVPDLMTMADEVVTLHARCVVCQKDATRTQRVVGDRFAKKDDKTIVIGGEDLYEARCVEHFVKPE